MTPANADETTLNESTRTASDEAKPVPWNHGSTRRTAGEDADARSTTGLRRAPVALTTSTRRGADNRRSQAVRFPLHLTPTIPRWRLHLRNHNDVTGQTGGPVTLTGLWVGDGWDAAFTATPQQVHGAVTVPANGTEWVSPWISTPLGGGRRMMLSAGLTNPAQTNILNPGGCWRNTSGSGASTAGTAAPAGYSLSTWAPLSWWLEVESAAPVIAGWGDSNTAGTGTTLPVNDSWLSQYARSVGALPMHVAFPGTAMFQWASASDRRWHRYPSDLRPDAVIHFMGQNDIAGTDSLAKMQARYNDTVGLLRGTVSPNVYLATITPSGRKTPAQNAVRRQYDTWLRTLPGGARDVFDFGRAVSTDDSTIASPFDSGDQLHFNTAGHAALAVAVIRHGASLAKQLGVQLPASS